MSIENELRELAKQYSQSLGNQIDRRVAEMQDDDRSHFLVYRVLGVTTQEGKMIDIYQNKGRFLYKYAGSFLEEATKSVSNINSRIPERLKYQIQLDNVRKHLKSTVLLKVMQ